MERDGIAFHNVAELCDIGHRNGELLQRVPESTRSGLNDGAANRVRHPAGVELRFVPAEPVEITLSTMPGGSNDEGTARIFWGPLQSPDAHVVDGAGTTIEITPPDVVAGIDQEVREDLAFDPRVCRVQLPGEHRGGHTLYHGVKGGCRPPRAGELPDRRYLAYGTSITEGERALGEHLTYVNQAARRIDADPINLGTCGSAYCDPAMAEYIATVPDLDVITLALSVNMVGAFPPDEFEARAAAMVETIADAHPETPVACITIFPNGQDVCSGQGSAGENGEFRERLRGVVADAPGNVHLLEGPDLLPSIAGHTTDILHPGDNAMITIGERLAAELSALLEE